MIEEMLFDDRADAGERLAAAVVERVQGPAVVLGVPRGGVLVAAPVAEALGVPLDVVVPKKVGAPGNPELGLGAVAPGVTVLDEVLIERLGVSRGYLEVEIAREQAEVARRTEAFREGRPPLDLSGLIAVVVDDGVATGGTALASIEWARSAAAASVVFAAPVAPPDVVDRLASAADEVIVLEAPTRFWAVGAWYRRFDQVGDDEVRSVLAGPHG